MEMPHVTQQRYLLSIVIQLSQIWHVVLQAQLELVLVTRHGVGIRQQKHANARILNTNWIQLEHYVVKRLKFNSFFGIFYPGTKSRVIRYFLIN